MKQTFTMLALALGMTLAVSQAQAAGFGAAALPPAGSPAAVEQVSGGCGPGGHRDGYGNCRPNRPPPGAYRRCPPGFHPSPYGCRRNY